MNSALGWGDTVKVLAVSRRVLREENKSGDGRGELLYRERAEEVSAEIAATGDWPEPDGKSHVRVCRETLASPAFGIVVGKTKRVEGYRVPGSYDWGTNSADADPPTFVGNNIVPVYEVALSVAMHRKARVVLVQPDDLEVQ